MILGSGLAGGNAAKTLRAEGFGGRLVMIGSEPGWPFGRPPLSKTYLRGEEAIDGWLVKPPDWYDENRVELIRATAAKVDVKLHHVHLEDGVTIGYSKLLIATGGRNRIFDVPGAHLEGVHQLRTVAESDAIRNAALRRGHAVIVGMGFIGAEVAASLRQLGLEVTTVMRGAAPLDSALGPEMGEIMAGIHKEKGVRLLSDEVVRFEGSGRLERAVTRSGARIECDLSLVAVGIQPNVEIIGGTDVAVDNGVLVDAACRTSVPDVFAAGDVANHRHPLFGRVRVEHYNNAEKQGASVARSMLGSVAAYDYLHTFWSDQYEHKLEYVGHVRAWDQFIVRGSAKDRRLIGFYLKDGIVRAAVGLNRGGDPELDAEGEMAKAAQLIARGVRPATAALADDDRDLAAL